MGHKTHPLGFRLGIIKDWKTHWYANNGAQYRDGVQQDLGLRRAIHDEYAAFSASIRRCPRRANSGTGCASTCCRAVTSPRSSARS